MVTRWSQALECACIVDLVTSHLAQHLHPRQLKPIPSDTLFERLRALYAEGVAITVPVAGHPLVTSASVQQGATAMPAGVEERSLHLAHRNLVPAVMRRMREIPRATHHAALAIGIVRIIADWTKLQLLARFVNVGSSHVALDLGPHEHVVVVFEHLLTSSRLHTKGFAIFVVII
jgi:hypothetical protein